VLADLGRSAFARARAAPAEASTAAPRARRIVRRKRLIGELPMHDARNDERALVVPDAEHAPSHRRARRRYASGRAYAVMARQIC
jgi:hypothetical protein